MLYKLLSTIKLKRENPELVTPETPLGLTRSDSTRSIHQPPKKKPRTEKRLTELTGNSVKALSFEAVIAESPREETPIIINTDEINNLEELKALETELLDATSIILTNNVNLAAHKFVILEFLNHLPKRTSTLEVLCEGWILSEDQKEVYQNLNIQNEDKTTMQVESDDEDPYEEDD